MAHPIKAWKAYRLKENFQGYLHLCNLKKPSGGLFPFQKSQQMEEEKLTMRQQNMKLGGATLLSICQKLSNSFISFWRCNDCPEQFFESLGLINFFRKGDTCRKLLQLFKKWQPWIYDHFVTENWTQGIHLFKVRICFSLPICFTILKDVSFYFFLFFVE